MAVKLDQLCGVENLHFAQGRLSHREVFMDGRALIQTSDNLKHKIIEMNTISDERRGQFHQDGGTDTAGSHSGSTASAIMVYAMHGLLLSGIELALTVGNAVDQDAVRLYTISDLVFGGSVVIKAVSFAFAMGMALRVLLDPVAHQMVGVGVPSMVIVETMAVEESDEENEENNKVMCLLGLGAQSLGFVVFAVIWIVSQRTVSIEEAFSWLGMASGVITFTLWWRHRLVGRWTNTVVLANCFAVPFVVEITESALLFTSDSVPFIGYLLAAMDLANIAPAVAIYVRHAVYHILFPLIAH